LKRCGRSCHCLTAPKVKAKKRPRISLSLLASLRAIFAAQGQQKTRGCWRADRRKRRALTKSPTKTRILLLREGPTKIDVVLVTPTLTVSYWLQARGAVSGILVMPVNIGLACIKASSGDSKLLGGDFRVVCRHR
jgi:hypothetical protein